MHEKSELGGLGERERTILNALAASERPVVTVDDVLNKFDVSRKAANVTLSRLARKGWLRRLRRGAYSVVPLSSRSASPAPEEPLALAMELFPPCYISGWTAAEHWGLTEQVSNSVLVYSADPQRKAEQRIGGLNFRVRRIPEEMIFGTTRIWYGGTAVEMATVHRTVVDVLDAPEMGGGGRQTLDIVRSYWSRPDSDAETLIGLAERIGRGSIFKRLGFTATRFAAPPDPWLQRCREHLSAGIALLDPAGPDSGPIASEWRLRVNIPVAPES